MRMQRNATHNKLRAPSRVEKKDIYEHLASIYLDSPAKGKKKSKSRKGLHTARIVSVASIVLLVASLVVIFSYHNPRHTTQLAMELNHDVIKINFNFDPASKETFTIKLNKIDLSRFKALSFNCRRLNYNQKVSLRVEFNSAYKEKSEVYFAQVPNKWEQYTVDFNAFKNISDWSSVDSLSFIVEEWNADNKNGVVFIDNVRLLG